MQALRPARVWFLLCAIVGFGLYTSKSTWAFCQCRSYDSSIRRHIPVRSSIKFMHQWKCLRWIGTIPCQMHARAVTFQVEDDCRFNSKINGKSILNFEIVTSDPNSTAPIPTSPRLWLESSPLGVYTVIRCDYHHFLENVIHRTTETTSFCPPRGFWFIWGREFHLQRLRDSMRALTSPISVQPTTSHISPEDLDHACLQTESIIDGLSSIDNDLEEIFLLEPATAASTIVMLTILWYEGKSLDPVVVRAHASCINNSIALGASTSGAVSDSERKCDLNLPSVPKWTIVVDVSSNTVSRQCYPQPYAKVSSWCTQRKDIEKRYMPQSMLDSSNENSTRPFDLVTVNEVILTQIIKSDETRSVDLHLLEGLTSNLFVVYPDNVIRTTGQGVLHGYSRHLVLEAIRTIYHPLNSDGPPSWTIDTVAPILLTDVHLWREVFCTSAIRLIVPVDRILVAIAVDGDNLKPSANGRATVRELWRYERGSQPQVWKQLLAFLLTENSSVHNIRDSSRGYNVSKRKSIL